MAKWKEPLLITEELSKECVEFLYDVSIQAFEEDDANGGITLGPRPVQRLKEIYEEIKGDQT
tara:strand:- start:103 stop:288 length:186 start_codon:yes stop_codon:yes gene_type:complete